MEVDCKCYPVTNLSPSEERPVHTAQEALWTPQTLLAYVSQESNPDIHPVPNHNYVSPLNLPTEFPFNW
jgi:hypothetical protein